MGGGCGLPEGIGGLPLRVKNGQTDLRENIIVVSDGPVVRENTRVVLLSVEAEEFSLRTETKIRVPTGEGSDSSENCVPSGEMHEGVVRRNDGCGVHRCRNEILGRCRGAFLGR